jgi:transposase
MQTNQMPQQNTSQLLARIAELEALVKYYEEQLRLDRHRRFGSSSEKDANPDQLNLFDEAENTADLNAPEPELEQITYTRRKQKGKREDNLSSLPVETVEHTLSEEEQVCAECGGTLHVMGRDTRRELKIIPAKVTVVEHNRSVYSCRNCEKNGDHVPIVKAPMPEPVIKGSLASPSSVAHIMTQKYVMCAPLYRQEQDWNRQGVSLSRQTMANWVIRCAEDWLSPVYERLRSRLLAAEVLHADETTVQVLNETGKTPQSESYMWVYRTSGDTSRHIVLYEYQPGRSKEYPKRFFSGYKGYLHTDGYAAYHALPNVTIVGCWVHMRRKFEDAVKALKDDDQAKTLAQEAIKRIGALFRLEEIWKELPPDERYVKRLKESKPIAESFFGWLNALKVNILPKSTMGAAISYALNQRLWLMNVYLDGRTEISNNRAENAVRPFTLGRKNWLFCNSVKGAQASSVIYSIIETAKANGLKPFEYLEFLFESMPNATIGMIDEFMPWGASLPERCHIPVVKGRAESA